jgi:putative flippase GtrA
VLGYTSIIADNIATNVVGLALGTAFRFALYRWWVFAARRQRPNAVVLTAEGAPLNETGVVVR